MHWLRVFSLVLGACALFLLSGAADAQNLSSVSGPEVILGDTSAEYRIGFEPGSDGREAAFAHRLHVQHSFNDAWRGRIFVVQSERGGAALEMRNVTLEVQNQFFEAREHGGWASTIRLEGIIQTDGERPGRVRASWLNQLDRGPWQFRGAVYFGKEFGDNARDGLTLETREEATYKIAPKIRFGAQMFHNYNTTAEFGSFAGQRHEIGPVTKIKVNKQVRIEASALIGVSKSAPDATLRVFASYAF